MEGFEIHDIDTNNIWAYIKSDNANVLSRCNKEKLLVTPPNPPIKFRKYWDDDIAKNEMVLKCVNSGSTLYATQQDNRYFFWNSSF